ncbi:MAG: DUF1501 domain-containing protein [Planctomycetota bacterium]|nr:DUF1501 domain-containing protein [Planctomycetaceae bacterium]MDQ3330030.1 DUF1501 domain-containing protein [Planctomycetota bacterium]
MSFDYLTRRRLLRQAGIGFGSVALASMLATESDANEVRDPLALKAPHEPTAKAKAVIWLFMNGGPSHVDTWDFKPELQKKHDQQLAGFDKNTGFFTEQVGPLMKSPFEFTPRGESGKLVSSLFPKVGEHVDDLAFLHSCWTDSNNHSPALFMMNTGMTRMGFPCAGAWATYGLGTVNQSLPAFVVMSDPLGRGLPKGYSQNWGAGFLPSVYQGTWLKPDGEPIDNLKLPPEHSKDRQRKMLDLLAAVNGEHFGRHPAEKELAARIESFELAYRMQSAAPEALDLAQETAETQSLYGLDDEKCAHFGKQCLIARRMVERGVRFVQIYSGGMENERSWDGHSDIIKNHGGFAAETDTPVAALLTDLKRQGLLDSTLVIWGGEFGRLPICQKGSTGRDHNPHAFTVWMAGGGVKGGVSHGATDEVGFKAVEKKVGVHDLHATILHLLGLDHERLTYRYSGRDFRLTDVAGNVVREILA